MIIAKTNAQLSY
uniref:Uncharacterized protein n=1 Tax=Anguilla anguilla TaxID=7936 RepID=A0A0E9V450_ANGAN